MNKTQVKGRINVAEGKIKEVAGNLTGNKSLEAKGKVQKAAGKIQSAVGDLAAELKTNK